MQMQDEDIEAQRALLSINEQNELITQTQIRIKPSILERIQKYKENPYCDWIIAIVLVVCVVATIVIIIHNN